MSTTLLVALFATLLAGVITGLTGFGLALISTTILLFVYEPRTVVVVSAILSILISAAVVWDSWREARRLALALLVPALFGIGIGTVVLGAIDPVYIRLGVGAIVIFSALVLASDPTRHHPNRVPMRSARAAISWRGISSTPLLQLAHLPCSTS